MMGTGKFGFLQGSGSAPSHTGDIIEPPIAIPGLTVRRDRCGLRLIKRYYFDEWSISRCNAGVAFVPAIMAILVDHVKSMLEDVVKNVSVNYECACSEFGMVSPKSCSIATEYIVEFKSRSTTVLPGKIGDPYLDRDGNTWAKINFWCSLVDRHSYLGYNSRGGEILGATRPSTGETRIPLNDEALAGLIDSGDGARSVAAHEMWHGLGIGNSWHVDNLIDGHYSLFHSDYEFAQYGKIDQVVACSLLRGYKACPEPCCPPGGSTPPSDGGTGFTPGNRGGLRVRLYEPPTPGFGDVTRERGVEMRPARLGQMTRDSLDLTDRETQRGACCGPASNVPFQVAGKKGAADRVCCDHVSTKCAKCRRS